MLCCGNRESYEKREVSKWKRFSSRTHLCPLFHCSFYKAVEVSLSAVFGGDVAEDPILAVG